MKDNVKIDFLRSVHMFSSLRDEELHDISGKILIKEFLKNEVILREEDTNRFMYIVLVGSARVLQVTEDGKEIILAIHGTGDFFGEMSLIDGRTSPATVIATEDSLIALITRRDFFYLLTGQRKILNDFLQILCMRLRDSWKKIEILNYKNAKERLRTLLLLLAHNSEEKTPEGSIINLRLTHENIASMSGLSRETVTRILGKWQEQGEIVILQNRLIRLNKSFMTKI